VTQTLYGLPVQISPDRPRYVLPKEVMPGVPWPAGFRAEINNWAGSFLGTWNLLDDSQAYRFGNVMVVSPRAYEALLGQFEQLFKPNLPSHYTDLD